MDDAPEKLVSDKKISNCLEKSLNQTIELGAYTNDEYLTSEEIKNLQLLKVLKRVTGISEREFVKVFKVPITHRIRCFIKS